MQARTIVVPIDFSEQSREAVQHAASLARDSGATLKLVHVHEPIERFADTGFAGCALEDDREEAEKRLLEIRPPFPEVAFTHTMLTGNPAEEIVRFAAKQEADMIVLGTHGRTGVSRLLMGSVAEAVVRGAKCPVLTIKQPVDANTQTACGSAQ